MPTLCCIAFQVLYHDGGEERVSITQGSPLINCSVRIEWHGNPRIGEFKERNGWRNRHRPAYDDRFKLLVLFDYQRMAKSARCFLAVTNRVPVWQARVGSREYSRSRVRPRTSQLPEIGRQGSTQDTRRLHVPVGVQVIAFSVECPRW